ncbi:hypothetical protein NPIL_532511 [Nephila pilipes]|uniref:Uncharacterized protein n=1 Tax=Nephila pilipes TaxID=299642 RepID=A0A8X6US60_NEPPI|nr:hypothetical protein NPIL_532511 [Nephila pilipes]
MKENESKSSRSFCRNKNTIILQDHDEKDFRISPGETNRKKIVLLNDLTRQGKTYVIHVERFEFKSPLDYTSSDTQLKKSHLNVIFVEFSLKGDLNRHLYIHSGDRSYVCVILAE